MRLSGVITRWGIAASAAALTAAGIGGAAYAATAHTATAHTGAAHAGAVAAVPRCTADDLGVWLAIDQVNGAAGTGYYPLQFTNLSRHTCSLTGYPGVSVLGSNSHQLGSPASWGPRTGIRTVLLAPGATAHTILAYGDVAVDTAPGCAPVSTAVALSVIPPDQRTATHGAYALRSCSRPGVVYLRVVEPIRPGPGTVSG